MLLISSAIYTAKNPPWLRVRKGYIIHTMKSFLLSLYVSYDLEINSFKVSKILENTW